MRLKGLSFGIALWAATGIAPAAACGLHGGPGGSLDVAYPGSLSVAVAIAAAKDSGRLPEVDPMRSLFAYQLATSRINDFANRLGAVETGAALEGFSIVLVGPRLWTAVTRGKAGLRTRVHVPGPMLGLPVILTDFLVIDSILKDRLSISDALAKGLIRIDGDRDKAVSQLLVTSLERPPETQ